jgi:hypothetical protein
VLTVLPPLLLTLLPAHVHARLLLLLLLLLLWQLLVVGCAAALAATYSSHSAVAAAAAAAAATGCCWLLCPAHWALRLLLSCAVAQRSCALPLLRTPWLPWRVL